MPEQNTGTLLELTADIVAAHLSYNQVNDEALPSLIQLVYRNLSTVGKPETEPTITPTPAVPVKKSVFPDFVVCLEDGKKLKMLKRYLQTSYGMTPDEYRAKWGLPRDYPMVAPNYASSRAALAKQNGLGRKAAQTPTQPEAEVEVKVTQLPARRARGSKK
ncbi:MAG: MucR family transcriptional regulator [Janthinobacterium lividum]